MILVEEKASSVDVLAYIILLLYISKEPQMCVSFNYA